MSTVRWGEVRMEVGSMMMMIVIIKKTCLQTQVDVDTLVAFYGEADDVTLTTTAGPAPRHDTSTLT